MSMLPKITALPEPSLSDEAIQVTLTGFPPSQLVTIYASTVASKHCIYESFANYKTSCNGTVDLPKDRSLFGTYTGIEPMGLFWSMIPFAESKKNIARLLKMDVTKPQIYHLSVFDEEKHSLEECRNTKKHKILTSLVINRWFMSPGVRRISVRENGIVATLFLPPGEGPFPGVINLFGGYPGILEFKSALHASHGFASLALAYVGAEDLPSSMLDKLDLEYFEKAVQFMKNHQNVQSDNGIGIFSICKGAQIAILMATYLKDIRCIVSINGFCYTGCGTFKYKDQNFDVDYFDYSKLIPDQDNRLAHYFTLPDSKRFEARPAFIPFHRKHGVSYMLVSGLDDTCVPSRFFIGEMERLLHEENHPDFEILKYEDAGHLIEHPTQPFSSFYYQPGPKFDTYLTNGGKMLPHCKSQEDSWPKALAFLKQRLAYQQNLE